MDKEMTRIVVLGGGYGGVQAAKIMEKAFKDDRSVEITLIDKNPYHTLMTELHEVAGGRVDPESILVSFRKIFGARRVNVVTDRIRTIDFESRTMESDSARYSYDYLVIGVGGEPEFYGIPGIQENTFTIWSYEDSVRIREHVEAMFREASREHDPERRKHILTFAVAGGGFTGVEVAGELMEWRKVLCRKHWIDESEVTIKIVELMGNILPIFPEKLQQKAVNFLEKHGVEVILNAKIVEAVEGAFRIKDGQDIQAGTMIWTCGVMGAEFAGNLALTKGRCSNRQCHFATSQGTCGVKECAFAKEHRYVDGKRGRLLATETMQSVDYDNVYVIGDVLWYVEGRSALPQIVETALQTAETAAHNIVARIRGGEQRKFKSNYHGHMVSIGGKYGLAYLSKIPMSGFMAMAMKHLVNVHYLFGLAGINAIWDYIRHHFLEVHDNRSIIGGHASYKVRIYWVAVLRVFLGGMWLYEGIKKIADGWLNRANLFLAGMSGAVDGAVTGATAAAGTAAPAAADAVTTATGAAEAAAPAVADAVTAATGAVADAVSAASQAAGEAVAYAVPLIAEPTGIYNWIMSTFVSGAPFFFQALIVLVEVGIGLALIGGLFTFVAAAVSIGLCLMFILGAMAGREILWFMVAAIVVLGGAGRGFGLDYWVMPWLKKWWNRTGLAKRSYLYLDEPTKPSKPTRVPQARAKVETASK